MPESGGEEEEEEQEEGGDLPSLDPTLDNQYYGFLNVPRFFAGYFWESDIRGCYWNAVYCTLEGMSKHWHNCYWRRTAEQSEITAAYKRLARLYHPDKHQVNLKQPWPFIHSLCRTRTRQKELKLRCFFPSWNMLTRSSLTPIRGLYTTALGKRASRSRVGRLSRGPGPPKKSEQSMSHSRGWGRRGGCSREPTQLQNSPWL